MVPKQNLIQALTSKLAVAQCESVNLSVNGGRSQPTPQKQVAVGFQSTNTFLRAHWELHPQCTLGQACRTESKQDEVKQNIIPATDKCWQ